MLTVEDVAARLSISKGLVYKAIREGKIVANRFGAALRISEDNLRQYLDSTEYIGRTRVTPTIRQILPARSGRGIDLPRKHLRGPA
jgi:excisionase family DNA binding protein